MEQETDVYSFDEIKEYIIGSYTISDWFSFNIYADKAPSKNDKVKIEDKIYIVESVIDDTYFDEFEQGLSYCIVWMSLYIC